jgi:hypothetical protein
VFPPEDDSAVRLRDHPVSEVLGQRERSVGNILYRLVVGCHHILDQCEGAP